MYMHQNTSSNVVRQMEKITGMNRGSFPLKYLDFPLSYSKKKKEDYLDLIEKIRGKLHALKKRLLSYRGKEVLIKSVL